MKLFIHGAGLATLLLFVLWLALIFNVEESTLRLDQFLGTLKE